MKTPSRLRSSCVARCLAIMGVTMLALTLQGGSAGAVGGLPSILLSKALPGFIQVPPGADNGPLSPTTIQSVFGNDTAAQRSDIPQMLVGGQISGYVRVWHSSQTAGDGLVEFAFQSPSATDLSLLLGGIEKGAASSITANGGHTFTVPGVPDALGYSVNLVNNQPPVGEFIVAFAKGNTAIPMTLVTSSYDLNQSEEIALGQRQWDLTPGTAIAAQTLPSLADDLFWGVSVALVVALAAIFWQRRRSRRLAHDNPAEADVRYALYKELPRKQKKVVRKALVKGNVFDDEQLNNAALAWANRQLGVYWTYLASFVAFDATVLIVSKGHVYFISFLAIAMLIGAVRLRGSRGRFMESRAKRVMPFTYGSGLPPLPGGGSSV